MPKISLLQTNFTGGEFAPDLAGRVDIAKYSNACKSLRNSMVLKRGGARRRYGTLMRQVAKNADKKAILVDFVVSNEVAYVLEFGDLYMRVFSNQGGQVEVSPGVPFEIATPFTEALLRELDFNQAADTMFVYSDSVFTQRLQHFAADNWVLEDAPFVQMPFDEVGHRFATVSLTLSAATVGAARTATAAGGTPFTVFDIGLSITSNGGVLKITGFTSSAIVTGDITTAFPGTAIAAGDWTLTGTPRSPLKAIDVPVAEPTEGTHITVIAGTQAALALFVNNVSMAWAAGIVTVEAIAHGLLPGDIAIVDIAVPDAYNGAFSVLTVPDADHYTFAVATDPGTNTAAGNTAKWTGVANVGVFRDPDDVGAIIRVNGGIVRIEHINDDGYAIRGLVLQTLATEAQVDAGAWTLENVVWSAALGFPRTGCLYEQRHIVAGTRTYPKTVWGSRIREPLNFEIGVADDKAFAYAIEVNKVTQIHYVRATNVLLVLTPTVEVTLEGGIEKPLTPTNVKVKGRTGKGCARVVPTLVDQEVMFAHRSGTKIRAFSSGGASGDGYVAPDITVFAKHLFELGATEIKYQQEPEPYIYAILGDGRLAACCYDRDADVNVNGWSPLDTDGEFESIAVIPAGNTEQVWALVKRTIDGNEVRYIEQFDFDRLLDCAVEGSVPDPGATVWAGFDHLVGEEIDVIADGAMRGKVTVNGAGEITLDRPALTVLGGLPYSGAVEPLTPEFQTGQGSAQGNMMGTNEVALRLFRSIGGKVNGQKIPTRRLGPDALDAPPIETTGTFWIENLGWDYGESVVKLEHDLGLRWHVLSVTRKITVNPS